MLVLPQHIRLALPPGDPFEAIMRLQGNVYRSHKNRRTIRVELGERRHGYFVKTHEPAGLREILKNALRGRWPVLTAKAEWLAIQRAEDLGVRTTHAIACGCRGWLPHRMRSFIITDELPNMIHVSDLAPLLQKLPVGARFRIIRALLEEIARIARTFHNNGLNHRDFYLCHFMVPNRNWACFKRGESANVHVIDLHRVQIRRRTPQRWIIKDISGLLFSSLDSGATVRDDLRFLQMYCGREWRDIVEDPAGRRFVRAVVRRAVKLYRSEHGKWPRLSAGLANFA
jgi:heptose I phosphotransferase